MGVYESRTFRSGNSEAVRLPKDAGFGIGTAMRIERDGNRIVPTPVVDEDERTRKFLEGMAALRALPSPLRSSGATPWNFLTVPGCSLPVLLDTDVAIHVSDGDNAVADRMEALGSEPFLSIVSRVELENGVHRFPADAARRRAALDALRAVTRTLPLDDAELAAYRSILDAAVVSRLTISDRMIAATALANGLTLIATNGPDFRDIPDLALEIWPSPIPPPS